MPTLVVIPAFSRHPISLFVIPVSLFVIPVSLFVIPAKAGINH